MEKQPQQYDSVEEGLRIIKELKITKSAFAHSICERYRVFNTMTYDEMMRCTLRDLVKYRIDCERQLEEKYKKPVKSNPNSKACKVDHIQCLCNGMMVYDLVNSKITK